MTKLLKFPYQATAHCTGSTNPRMTGNAAMSCYPPGSFSHRPLLSQNTPCNRSLIVVASTQSVQTLTRCCQSGKWGGKRSFSCYKHDRAWSAAIGISRRTSRCFMAAVLTDKGLSSAGKQPQLPKKALWNVASSFYHFSGSGNASPNLSCCVDALPAGQGQVFPGWAAEMAPERLCSV